MLRGKKHKRITQRRRSGPSDCRRVTSTPELSRIVFGWWSTRNLSTWPVGQRPRMVKILETSETVRSAMMDSLHEEPRVGASASVPVGNRNRRPYRADDRSASRSSDPDLAVFL